MEPEPEPANEEHESYSHPRPPALDTTTTTTRFRTAGAGADQPASNPQADTDTNANPDHAPASASASASPSPSPPPTTTNNNNATNNNTTSTTPPYWKTHHRNASHTSTAGNGNGITLEDHTEDPDSATNRGLWARSVSVDDYVVVQGQGVSRVVGTGFGAGAYVVWYCRVLMLEGGPITIRMRYSEFVNLRKQLLAAFPFAKNALPALPPKSILYRFRPSFLESRRVGLEYFLNCVLLNPEFAGSPIVKDFLFGRSC